MLYPFNAFLNCFNFSCFCEGLMYWTIWALRVILVPFSDHFEHFSDHFVGRFGVILAISLVFFSLLTAFVNKEF